MLGIEAVWHLFSAETADVWWPKRNAWPIQCGPVGILNVMICDQCCDVCVTFDESYESIKTYHIQYHFYSFHWNC